MSISGVQNYGNSSYGYSNNNTAKVNGRDQTIMSASFTDVLASTTASNTTTATKATDKVTISTQATQTNAQSDIETEAQAMTATLSLKGQELSNIDAEDYGYGASTEIAGCMTSTGVPQSE